MVRPARTAEEEMPNADNMGDPVGGGLATLPADDVRVCFHICISGFYGQTEGDFPDFFWGFVRLVQDLSACEYYS